MSAEVLRRAASLMRERAEAATDGVCPEWTRSAVRHIARNCDIECWHEDSDPLVEKYHDADGLPEGWSRYDDASHIASWHPTVALSVAAWLDDEAESFDTTELWFHPDDGASIQEDKDFMFKGSLAVARAYLGESA